MAVKKGQYNKKARKRAIRNKSFKFLKSKSVYYLIAVLVVGIYALLSGYLPAMNIAPSQGVIATQDNVAVLNVGQADSSLITSDGVFCLIDAGQTEDGKDRVVKYLKKAGVKEIELFVITHFHSDHMSEALDVLENFNVKNILIPNLTQENMPTSNSFDKLISKIEGSKTKIHTASKGDRYTIGKGEILVMDDTINTIDINNTSVATLFHQGDFYYLNTGDGEKKYEEQLAEKLFKVTLFKGGHHGSKTSNITTLLDVIQPKIVAISAGADNSYGHPHVEAMERLQKTGAQIDITYRDGTLVYLIQTGQRVIEGEK